MRSRRSARESALQALYQCDSLHEWTDEIIGLYFESFTRESLADESKMVSENFQFCRDLIGGVRDHLEFVDSFISQSSTHWNLERMARVDRNILRLAAFEIGFLPEIPVNVSINEGIEIAKRYGADDSPMFINGVLDRLAGILKESTQEIDSEKRRLAASGSTSLAVNS